MTLVQVEIEGAGAAAALFSRKARFAGSFMQVTGREQMNAVKDDIADEIEGQYYLAGGRKAWAPAAPIGFLPAGRPMLKFMGRAWSGAEPRVSATKAELEITAPGAGAHVGGTGLTRTSTVTAIRARGNPGSMQTAILRKTGGLVSRATLTGPGLQLPSRQHANPDNPVTAGRIERILVRRFGEA